MAGRGQQGIAGYAGPRATPGRVAGALGTLIVMLGGPAMVGGSGMVGAAADLDRPLSAAWTAVPLADVSRRLAVEAQRPIIIDRRIDPTRRVSLEADGEAVSSVMARLAALANARAIPLGSSIWILPDDRATIIAAADVRRQRDIAALPEPLRRRARAAAPWSWPDGAVPADLLRAAAAAGGFELGSLESLPHDHFRASELPPLPVADRLDLILGQFDRRLDWSRAEGGRPGSPARVPIVALAEGIDPLGRDRPRREPFVAASPRLGPGAPRDPGRERFTLRAEAPLDELLAAVARRTGLTLAIDRAAVERAGLKPAVIVRVEVRDATRDQLLDAVTGPLGLGWRITGDRLEVPGTPADRPGAEAP
ncbi:MAG: hypothetical protein ACOYK7_06700 [Pirellulales bacterium]